MGNTGNEKKILALVLIVALLAVMVVPSAALAAGGSSIVSGAMPVGALTKFVVTTSGPQMAGSAFTINIIAEDPAGNTVATFTGTVTLTETGGGAGGTVSPATSSAFVAGVLTNQSMTLTRAGTGVTPTATNEANSGVSGSFTVNPGTAAKLQVLMSGETEHRAVLQARRIHLRHR